MIVIATQNTMARNMVNNTFSSSRDHCRLAIANLISKNNGPKQALNIICLTGKWPSGILALASPNHTTLYTHRSHIPSIFSSGNVFLHQIENTSQ
jgi:hypothetical protein